MPAVTRVKVEAMVQDNPSRSLVSWLNNVARLLERERPARKRGAPRAISQVFVSRIATIWRTLGLKAGLAYNFFLHPANDDRIGCSSPAALRIARLETLRVCDERIRIPSNEARSDGTKGGLRPLR